MYKAGTFVIYRNEGVCEIKGIIQKEFRDNMMEYYVLNPVHNKNAEVLVPKNNADLVAKMRDVLSKEEIMAIIRQMPDEEVIWIDNEEIRKEKYKEIISEGDRIKLVRLIKTLYLHKEMQKKSGRKLHIADERILKDAEHILYDEVAFVLNISQNEVVPFINEQLSAVSH